MLLITSALTGCFGIAHKFVSVPQLEVQVRTPSNSSSETLDVIRPEFWADGQTFLAIVKDSLVRDGVPYEWRSVTANEGFGTPVMFQKEERYIGYPVFIVPLPPSAESSRNRRLFFRAGSDEIYRISIAGDKAVAEATSLSKARASLPAALLGARPKPLTPEWRTWDEAEEEFYRNVKWTESVRLSVLQLRRDSDRDVLSLQIANKVGG